MKIYLLLGQNAYLALGLVVIPGIIVLFVRAQFVAGRRVPYSEAVLSYLTVSALYYGLLILVSLIWLGDSGYVEIFAWGIIVFVVPALLGILLGIDAHKGLVRRFLQLLKLNPIHTIPTAWDWKFSRRDAQWVLVTLTDGTRFAGFLGSDSFISFSSDERDMYIQYTYDIDDKGAWVPRGNAGVLIASGMIKTVEFWPYDPKEDFDGPR